ncbi:MAG TPA: hypothetical protein VFA03_09465 [Acetobacteraceae bacterium]|nr:hypothetical protein [Acetobacteraceae bacterium]
MSLMLQLPRFKEGAHYARGRTAGNATQPAGARIVANVQSCHSGDPVLRPATLAGAALLAGSVAQSAPEPADQPPARTGNQQRSLSSKLAQSNGTIQLPPTDPTMEAKPQQTGRCP